MPRVTLDAVILQAFPYSETSKILRLYTRSHGVQSVIAKGARRPKSRYGGILEPFTDGVVSFHYRPGRDLHTLSDFELVRTRQRLGRDLVRFGAASLLAELLIRTGSEDPAPDLFDRLRDALADLEDAGPAEVEPVALARAWAMVTSLGFAPSLDRCVGCGRSVEEEADLFLDYMAGGVLCGGCGAPAGAGRTLPPRARRDLAALAAGQPVALERSGAHWQLLGRFLDCHLVEPGALRSLDFLAEAVETP